MRSNATRSVDARRRPRARPHTSTHAHDVRDVHDANRRGARRFRLQVRRDLARARASERAITAFRHSPASPSAPRVDESSGAPRLLFGRNRFSAFGVWFSHIAPHRRRVSGKNFLRKEKTRLLSPRALQELTRSELTLNPTYLLCFSRFVRFVTPHASSRQHTG